MNSQNDNGNICVTRLGLSDAARTRLAEISGATPEVFFNAADSKQAWRSTSDLASIKSRTMYVTTTWSVPDGIDSNGRRLHLSDGLWLDIDARKDTGETAVDAVKALASTVTLLQRVGIQPEQCSLFASGGKGFHVFVPMTLLIATGMASVGIATARVWPYLCRTFVVDNLVTVLTDMNIYSGGKGRLFRQPNVQRDSGLYKVPLRWDEWQHLDVASYAEICSSPRPAVEPVPVSDIAPAAAMAWVRALRQMLKPVRKPQRKPRMTGLDGKLLPDQRRDIVRALTKLEDLEYQDWFRVGCALKSTGASDALDLWTAWSKASPKYRAGECADRWDGISGDTVSVGTIFHLASSAARAGGGI